VSKQQENLTGRKSRTTGSPVRFIAVYSSPLKENMWSLGRQGSILFLQVSGFLNGWRGGRLTWRGWGWGRSGGGLGRGRGWGWGPGGLLLSFGHDFAEAGQDAVGQHSHVLHFLTGGLRHSPQQSCNTTPFSGPEGGGGGVGVQPVAMWRRFTHLVVGCRLADHALLFYAGSDSGSDQYARWLQNLTHQPREECIG
jgi:hypothetical protein